MYIHWEKQFETGQPLIDAEHRLLVMFFRKLDVAIKTKENVTTISRIIIEVRKFVEFHFASEENLMSETAYPDLEKHRARHAELLLELNSMVARVASHREYPEDLLVFLNDWLRNHIANDDQLVAQHARRSVDRPIAEMMYAEFFPPASTGNSS